LPGHIWQLIKPTPVSDGGHEALKQAIVREYVNGYVTQFFTSANISVGIGSLIARAINQLYPLQEGKGVDRCESTFSALMPPRDYAGHSVVTLG